jgi:c-di-GMP-binding flagellar brake protein YcgR
MGPSASARRLRPPKAGDWFQIWTGNRGARTVAQVISVQGNTLELLLAPAGVSIAEQFRPGQDVRLFVPGGDAGYLHCATCVRQSGPRTVFVTLRAPNPERVQRRAYFRMRLPFSCLIDLSSWGANRGASVDLDLELPPASARIWTYFLGVDLSGGGLCCLDPQERLSVGRTYPLRIQLPGTSESLPVRAEVVRRLQAAQGPAAGLCFVTLKEKTREQILQILFAEYRRQRRQPE